MLLVELPFVRNLTPNVELRVFERWVSGPFAVRTSNPKLKPNLCTEALRPVSTAKVRNILGSSGDSAPILSEIIEGGCS